MKHKLSLEWTCAWCSNRLPRSVCLLPDESYNYAAALQRLVRALDSPEDLLAKAFRVELFNMPTASDTLFRMSAVSLRRDAYSTSMLQHCAGVPLGYFAACASANGSCLFNSASLLISGQESILGLLHVHIRLSTTN